MLPVGKGLMAKHRQKGWIFEQNFFRSLGKKSFTKLRLIFVRMLVKIFRGGPAPHLVSSNPVGESILGSSSKKTYKLTKIWHVSNCSLRNGVYCSGWMIELFIIYIESPPNINKPNSIQYIYLPKNMK